MRNMQRVVRIGDPVRVKKTNQMAKIYNIREAGGQYALESVWGDVVAITVVPDGVKAVEMSWKDIDLIFNSRKEAL